MSQPILTIAVPTYNRSGKLSESVDRILEQIDGYDIELLVSDNCSQDDTESVMRTKTAQCPKIKYIRNDTNIGPDRNFLSCFEKATGEYVWLVGDDDMLLPGAVESVVRLLGEKPVFMHLNSCSILDEQARRYSAPRFEEGEPLRFTDRNELLEKTGIYITFMSALVMRTDLIAKIENKEQYNGTYFIQTHIAMRTLAEDGLYIINTHNCLAATPNETVGYDLYYVWFKRFRELIIETGERSGFDKSRLREVYRRETNKGVYGILKGFRWSCRENQRHWDKKCVFDAIRDFDSGKLKFYGAVYCPYVLLPVYNRVMSIFGV